MFEKGAAVRFIDDAGQHRVGNLEFKCRDYEDSWSIYVAGVGRMIVAESALTPWHEPGTR